jgi:hypothetical protein
VSWAPGDLALCVDTADRLLLGRRATAGRRYRKGAIYTVSAVGVHRLNGQPVLWLDADPKSAAADRFRKVTPGADINGFEEPRRVPVKEEV